MDEDQDVIGRVLDGDVESFRLLVKRYERQLYRLICNLVPDAHDGEDIAQEVFLTAYRRLATYDSSQGAFSTWLFTIARNKCFNALKKRRPVFLYPLPETPMPRTPDAELSEAEWFRSLNKALDALPFVQKTVFVLAEIQELSLQEIAQIEGVPVGTVKSRLGRAKEKLRALLRPEEQPDGRP
ncbi:MAG TPA: sigma-70 family RNA polymerase sigma factor [Gemmataceae bacterium]|jgi:RNA polymerase sigma-70 factor (ECF subfamily)